MATQTNRTWFHDAAADIQERMAEGRQDFDTALHAAARAKRLDLAQQEKLRRAYEAALRGLAFGRRFRGRSAGTSSATFDLGTSPLAYNTYGAVLRLSIVDPKAPPPSPKEAYFVPTERTTSYGKNGKRLAKPRIIERLPGAAPGTIAWLDYEVSARDGDIFVHYANVRSDMRGRGLGDRLVNELLRRYGTDIEYDFGKVMSEPMLKIVKRVHSLGARVRYKDYWTM